MENVPIQTRHLFAVLDHELVKLLHTLSDKEWSTPTVARRWSVKDVAAHLLDGNLRIISMLRDNYFGDPPLGVISHDDLVMYLNRLNADWITAMKRVSPSALLQLLENTAKEYLEQILELELEGNALFPVSWAGEAISLNWFHIAREYTEKWHHQQQIRDALNRPGIMTNELYYPVLDTFMMALPHTYRNRDAQENDVVQVSITGTVSGDWFLIKKEKWQLEKKTDLPVKAHTIIDSNIAWKIFTKSWRRKDVMNKLSVSGDKALGEAVLDMISVMA